MFASIESYSAEDRNRAEKNVGGNQWISACRTTARRYDR
jgi:hypothetical protein